MALVVNVFKIHAAHPNSCAALNLLLVRHRKPRWLPRSASKMFKVREPTPIDPVESKELDQRYRKYTTQMRAVRTFIFDWSRKERDTMLLQDSMADTASEVEDAKLREQNRLWNELTAQIREERQLAEAMATDQRNSLRSQRIQERRRERIAAASQLVHDEIVASEAFIKLDDLDIEIDKALNSQTDYNFAIDVHGNKYTKDGPLEEEGETSMLPSPQQGDNS